MSKLLALLFTCLIALSVGAVSFRAQQSSRAAVPGQLEMRAREGQRREMEQAATRKREPQQVLAEVNEDLGRLNVLRDGITTTLTAGSQQLNYKTFIQTADEIKMRGIRLRTDLALPLDEKAQKRDVLKGIDIATLPPTLSVLEKLLSSFLHNPVFTDSGAVDLQLAAKARQDLEDIIVVSEKVRKTAEKLSKSKTP